MQTARNRKATADEHFQKRYYSKARSKYEKALNKIVDGDCYHPDAHALCLKLQAKLAVTSLKLGQYVDVHRRADAATATIYDFRYDLRLAPHPWSNKEYAKAGYHTAYWAKGVAFEKLGKIGGAIRQFELAMGCDDTDEFTYHRLEALKKLQADRSQTEQTRIDQLQEQEARMRKHEVRKLRQKDTRKAKGPARKTRGRGYVLGIGKM